MGKRLALATVAAVLGILGGCGSIAVDLPQGFAIIYGVADYQGLNNLSFSDNDAQDVYDLLTSPAQGYEPENVILRVNSAATKYQLELDFQDIAGRINALEDPSASRFLFYFAGHGYGDGMKAYYGSFPSAWYEYFGDAANSDEPLGAGSYTEYLFLHTMSLDYLLTEADVETRLRMAAEGDDDLARHMQGIASRQKIVVIDACHSGGFIGDGTSVDSVPRAFDGDETGISIIDGLNAITVYAGFDTLTPADVDSGTVVISAAGEQEFSYEYGATIGIENGVFTHYLLQAPGMADINFDGFVTVSEAYAYATHSIDGEENPYLIREQKFMPRLGAGGIDFVLFNAVGKP